MHAHQVDPSHTQAYQPAGAIIVGAQPGQVVSAETAHQVAELVSQAINAKTEPKPGETATAIREAILHAKASATEHLALPKQESGWQ